MQDGNLYCSVYVRIPREDGNPVKWEPSTSLGGDNTLKRPENLAF